MQLKEKIKKYIKSRSAPQITAAGCIVLVVLNIAAAAVSFMSSGGRGAAAVSFAVLILTAAAAAVTVKAAKAAHDGASKDGASTLRYNFLATKRSELIRKLLVGNFSSSREEFEENGIIFDKTYFGVVTARIDRLKEIDPAKVPTMKFGIMNIGDDVLSKTGRVYSIEPNEYDIAWVINYEDYHPLLPAVEQVQKFVESIYGITASFGCNFGAESAEDISDLFRNSLYSLSYRLSKGYNSIILYNSIKDLAKGVCEYPEQLEREIMSDISAQNGASMKAHIHEFAEKIAEAPYSTVIGHANRLISASDKLVSGIAAEDDITVNYVEIMTRMETIAEIERFIAAHCESVMQKCAKKSDPKQSIADEISNYIDDHFRDSNLSVDMIAGEVNRSASYMRTIFKQSRGISVSEYISNKRFDEVCRLLIETDLPAQEIGKRAGLSSGPYFYTAFKKHTGYTPDQYRNIHKHQ